MIVMTQQDHKQRAVPSMFMIGAALEKLNAAPEKQESDFGAVFKFMAQEVMLANMLQGWCETGFVVKID